MKKVNNNDTIKTVFKYIKKYRIPVILSLLFAVVTVVLTLYLPVLIWQKKAAWTLKAFYTFFTKWL